MPSALFRREALAKAIAEQVLQASATSAASSGVFLAAPRRTGKSTFLREDLRPAFTAAGALVIYVDLWADTQADPSQVIVAAIRAALAAHEPTMKKLAKNFGIEGGRIAGVQFSLDRIGLGKDVSLVQALALLSDESEKVIVLIIDEAQHAMTSTEGSDTLFSLKAARDELNSSAHRGLRVVCTGSNRDKLSMLRNSKDQAFFGAPLINFPHLGRDYIGWFCANVKLLAPLEPDAVEALFARASFRPEILGAAADAVRFDFALAPSEIPARFAAAVDEQLTAANDDIMRVIHSLPATQSAVLRVMAVMGPHYAPFEAQTTQMYRAALQRQGVEDTKFEVTTVQQALLALQEKSLVWKAARGVYAIEDASLVALMKARGLLDGLNVGQQP